MRNLRILRIWVLLAGIAAGLLATGVLVVAWDEYQRLSHWDVEEYGYTHEPLNARTKYLLISTHSVAFCLALMGVVSLIWFWQSGRYLRTGQARYLRNGLWAYSLGWLAFALAVSLTAISILWSEQIVEFLR